MSAQQPHERPRTSTYTVSQNMRFHCIRIVVGIFPKKVSRILLANVKTIIRIIY